MPKPVQQAVSALVPVQVYTRVLVDQIEIVVTIQ